MYNPQSHLNSGASTSHPTRHCFADYLLTPLPHHEVAAQREATVTAPLQGGNNFMHITSTIIYSIYTRTGLEFSQELGNGIVASSTSITNSSPGSHPHTGWLDLAFSQSPKLKLSFCIVYMYCIKHRAKHGLKARHNVAT